MNIYLLNTTSGLKPLYDDDFEEKKKLKIGETYRATIVRPRNLKFHKKAMALYKIGCENSKSVEMPFDSYRRYATIKAGYAKIYHTPKGTYVEAESIAFDSMDEDRFQKVYNDVLSFIIIDTGADREMIEHELMSFM